MNSRTLGGRALGLSFAVIAAACGGGSGAVDAGATGGQGGNGSGSRGSGGGGGGSSCPVSTLAGPLVDGDPTATTRWSRPFTLSHYLGPELWTNISATSAVDSTGRLYLTDARNIFVANGSGVRVLRSEAQLKQDFGATDFGVSSIDLGPDDRLFALVDLSLASFTTALYASDSTGALKLFADFKAFWPNTTVIAAVTSDVVLAPFESLYCVTATAATPLYGPNVGGHWDTYGCSYRGIASERNGVFYYLPGCNGSPVMGGRVDGSGVKELARVADLGVDTFHNFGAIARAPHGGTIANLETGFFYIDQNNTHVPVTMSPSITEVRKAETNNPAGEKDFTFCGTAVAPDDTIYIACPGYGHVYRAVPTPLAP